MRRRLRLCLVMAHDDFMFTHTDRFRRPLQGVFIGVSVEAGTLFTRKDANRDFYGSVVTPGQLLLGDYPPPKAAEPLYNALREVRVR